LSYNNAPKSHWDYFHKIERNGEKVVEASRLVLHPQHRTIRTSKFLTDCAVIIYLLKYITQKHAVKQIRLLFPEKLFSYSNNEVESSSNKFISIESCPAIPSIEPRICAAFNKTFSNCFSRDFHNFSMASRSRCMDCFMD
jgi:hypothetical protein